MDDVNESEVVLDEGQKEVVDTSRQKKVIGTMARLAEQAGVQGNMRVLGSFAAGVSDKRSDVDFIFLGKEEFDKFNVVAADTPGLVATATDWEGNGISRKDYRVTIDGQETPVDIFYAIPAESNGVNYWEIHLPEYAIQLMEGKPLGIPESGIDGGEKSFDGVTVNCISMEYTLAVKLGSGLEHDIQEKRKLLSQKFDQERLARIQQDAKTAGIALRMPDEVGHVINAKMGLKLKK